MTFKRTILASVLCAAFAALFAVTAGARSAHADTNATTTMSVVAKDSCVPSAADLQQIVAIENDPTLSSYGEIKSELAARKQLLGKTIACAQNEVTGLQSSLGAIVVSGDVAGLQSQLVSKLNDAMNFYNIELDKLSGVGISGSEAVARETLAYRTGSYEPLAAEVNNFILWSGSQDLFATAQSRINQTSRAVSFLESATPSVSLQSAFSAAQASWQDATAENQAAKSALMQSLPPSQSLLLIQKSLTSLASTYRQFFAVSSIIKTLLPQ